MILGLIIGIASSAVASVLVSMITQWTIGENLNIGIVSVADVINVTVTLAVFAIVFAFVYYFKNDSKRRDFLKYCEENQGVYGFASDIKLVAIEEKTNLFIFAALSLICQTVAHIGMQSEDSSFTTVISMIGYPFSFATQIFGDYSGITSGLFWKGAILYIISTVVLCGLYILAVCFIRNKWRKDRFNLTGGR